MQVISENEDEGRDSRGTGAMNPLICTRRISRCMERERYGRIGIRRGGIRIGGRFLTSLKREFGGGEEESVKADRVL